MIPPRCRLGDVVGVSSMTGYQLKGAISWLKYAKLRNKRNILVNTCNMQTSNALKSRISTACLFQRENGLCLMQSAVLGLPKTTSDGKHISPVSKDTLVHFERSQKQGIRYCFHLGVVCLDAASVLSEVLRRHWESADLDRWKSDVLISKNTQG